MEMVKVEIQKLQLLNDRIAQTIEALNQVRMSMQGIQHTQFTPYGYPPTPFGFAQQQQFGQQAYGQPFTQAPVPLPVPYGVQGYGTPWTPSPFGGIQHTAWDPTWQTRATAMQAWPFTLS